MTTLRVAAVQASYVLMDRDATIDRVAGLTAAAARDGAQLVIFPEVFVPGTPIWIDTRVIWDGDEEWFGLLAGNAVVIPGPAAERLGAIAADHGVWLVVGVSERSEHGATIYNTVLYYSPEGALAGRHRKLMPTGSERTVWGMGDGSTLRVVDTGMGRIGGLTCWENYMPLDLDLRTVAAERRLMDPVGHYNRPDVFRLLVDTSPRPAVVETGGAPANSVAANLAARTCGPTEV